MLGGSFNPVADKFGPTQTSLELIFSVKTNQFLQTEVVQSYVYWIK